MILYVNEIKFNPNGRGGLDHVFLGEFTCDGEMVGKMHKCMGKRFVLPIRVWKEIDYGQDLIMGIVTQFSVDNWPRANVYAGKMQILVSELL